MKNLYRLVFSYLYFAVSSLYSLLFKVGVLKTRRFKNIVVVSVGNLTAGGSGKTPFIILLSKLLSKQKIKHSIVSRGYKKTFSGNAHMFPEKNLTNYSPSSFGDEPFMLFKLLKTVPVFVGNKLRSLLKLQSVFPGSVALIDDGYQTYELFKDINVLLLDCSLDISLYKTLPQGLLREPIKELERADILVLTKTNLTTSKNLSLLKKHFYSFINKKTQLVLSSEYCSSLLYVGKGGFERVDLNSFRFNDIGVVSVCGIANPKSFKKTLGALNVSVLKSFVFSNHYKYSSKNIKGVKGFCLTNKIKTIVTTSKDFYKIKPLFSDFEFYLVNVEHRVFDYDKLVRYFEKKLAGNFK